MTAMIVFYLSGMRQIAAECWLFGTVGLMVKKRARGLQKIGVNMATVELRSPISLV